MEIQVEIQGVTPVIMNRFTDAAQISATSGSRSSIANDEKEPRDDAEERLYVDDKGTPIFPGVNIFQAIISGGRFSKLGKSKVTTLKTSLIPAAVSILEEAVPIQSTGGWKVDTRPIRIPSTGGRILRHRPCFDDWKVKFTLRVDEKMISQKMIREIVDNTGARIGLFEYRPECKGPFGRFVVTNWKASKEAVA